jgi:hypothetical protein
MNSDIKNSKGGNPLPFTLEGKVNLFHYTNQDLGEETILDPIEAKKRAQYYSMNDYKRSDVARVFYYTDLTKTEPLVVRSSNYLYKTTVSGDTIFNIIEAIEFYRKSPDTFKLLSLEIFEIINNFMKMGGMNFQYLLEKLQKHFDGIYYDGQYPIVNMFVPLEVHKIDFEK